MRWFKKHNGSISIFLVIIFLAVTALSGVVIDASRMSAGRANVQASVDSAVMSVLAAYDQELEELFGVFGLNETDKAAMKQDFESYLKQSLLIEKPENTTNYLMQLVDHLQGKATEDESYLWLYQFAMGDTSVEPLYSLADPDVLEYQILDFMKFRAPARWLENAFLSDAIGGLGSVNEIAEMEKVVENAELIEDVMALGDSYDEKVVKPAKDIQDQVETTDAQTGVLRGTFSRITLNKVIELKEAEKRAVEGFRDRLDLIDGWLDYDELEADDRQDLLDERDEVETELASEQARYRTLIQAEEEKIREAIDDARYYLEVLEAQISQLQDDIAILESSIEEVELEGREYNEKAASLSNETAVQDTQKILDILADDSALTQLKSDLASRRNELSAAESAISQREEILDALPDYTTANQDTDYDVLLQKLNTAQTKLSHVNLAISDIRFSNPYVYEYARNPAIEAEFTDQEREDLHEELVLDTDQDINETSGANGPEEAPDDTGGKSGQGFPAGTTLVSNLGDAYKSPDFKAEDEAYVKAMLSELLPEESEDTVSQLVDEGFFNLGTPTSLSDNRAMLEKLLGIIQNAFENALYNQYVDEYIQGTFKTRITDKWADKTKPGNGRHVVESRYAKELDLRLNEKASRITALEAEIEYIIEGKGSAGSPESNANKLEVYWKIYGIRMLVNLVAIYRNAEVMAVLRSLAAMLAALSFGVGYHVYLWAMVLLVTMAESFIDMDFLIGRGYAVSFLKLNKGTFISAGKVVALIKNGGRDAYTPMDDGIMCKYEDYLRLFLLAVNDNKKLKRVGDLIQSNMYYETGAAYDLNKKYTVLRVDNTVTMNYMFATKPFVPKTANTPTGRYKIRNLVYQGY